MFRAPIRRTTVVAIRLPSVTTAMLKLMSTLSMTSEAPSCPARSGTKEKLVAQLAYCCTMLRSEGKSTSERLSSRPRLPSEGALRGWRSSLTGAITRMARPAAAAAR